jgi:hypothetical protein
VDVPKYDFAPVQLLAIAFDGNRFKGEILPELERLKEAGIARVIDLLAVRKDSSGAVTTLTSTDLEWEEATHFGAYVGTLIGFGVGGPDGADRGAIAGAAELSDGHVFDQKDIERLTASVPAGMTVGIALIEHRWMLPLLHAVERSSGFEVASVWVRPEDLVELGVHSAIENEVRAAEDDFAEN